MSKNPKYEAQSSDPATSQPTTARPKCGIIMPISALDGYSDAHWSEVKEILEDSIETAGFEPSMVSFADEVTLIHKTIVQNLYDNPVVVCDVSGKNANVMFELGLRLAFDRPTIVVKDDKTTYSFDTSPVEHVPYPGDLRYAGIVDFKRRLTDKIKATARAAVNPNYSAFLKSFGEFTKPTIESREVPGQEYMIDRLNNLTEAVGYLVGISRRPASNDPELPRNALFYARFMVKSDNPGLNLVLSKLDGAPGIRAVRRVNRSDGMCEITIEIDGTPSGAARERALQAVANIPDIEDYQHGVRWDPTT
jgi:hypothetical protein